MASRYALLTASLLGTVAIGAGAVQIAADLAARRELRRIVVAHPDVKIGSVRVEPFAGRIILDNVAAGRDPAAHVSVGRLILAGPSIGFGLVSSAHAESALDSAVKALDAKPKKDPEGEEPDAEPEAPAKAPAATAAPAPAPAAIPGTATAENVVITSRGTTYRIKRIDLTGTTLTNAELASLFDLNAADPLETRLKKLNATSIAVPEILVDDPTAGSEGHVAASQVLFSGVVAGRATAMSVGAVTFEGKTGSETTRGTVGAIQGFGVDFGQIAHVFGTVRKDDAEPILPLYDSISISGVSASNGKGDSFTMALLKETDLKARPLKTDLIASAKAGQKRSKAEDLALFQDFARSVEIGSLDMVDVVAHGSDPKGPANFALASVGLRGFGKGRFGGLGLRGFRIDGPKVRVGLGVFELGAIEYNPDTGATAGPATVKADVDRLDVDVVPEETATSKEPVRFKLGHAGFLGIGQASEVPTQIKFAFDNITFDLPANQEGAKPLLDMGYRHLDLSAALATTYDAGAQELKVRNLTLKGADMGTLDLGLHFANVTKGIVSTNKEVQKAAAVAILVKGVTLDVVNQGLVDRGIAWKAKQDGQSVDAEKASIIEFFDKALPEQIKSANVKKIGSAVAKFIADPKTLHVSVASKGGLGVGAMGMLNDPALLMDTLEVEAKAN